MARRDAEVNAQLRNLWHHIELDPRTKEEGGTMEPVRAVWNVGEEPWDAQTRDTYERSAGEKVGA